MTGKMLCHDGRQAQMHLKDCDVGAAECVPGDASFIFVAQTKAAGNASKRPVAPALFGLLFVEPQ